MLDHKAQPHALIFTDLDGTLLDHYTYSHAAADPYISELDRLNIPLIPTTSKTRTEVEALRLPYSGHLPMIIENGAAVVIPKRFLKSIDRVKTDTTVNIIEHAHTWTVSFSQPRSHWLALIDELKTSFCEASANDSSPDSPAEFTHFKAMGSLGIAIATGLSKRAATLANHREYSEPVMWLGTEERKQQFIKCLSERSAFPQQGGRFLTIGDDCDKGRAMLWLSNLFQAQSTEASFCTIALGDSYNDVSMLNAADKAFIVRSPKHQPPELDQHASPYVSQETGDHGWAECIQKCLNSFEGLSRSGNAFEPFKPFSPQEN